MHEGRNAFVESNGPLHPRAVDVAADMTMQMSTYKAQHLKASGRSLRKRSKCSRHATGRAMPILSAPARHAAGAGDLLAVRRCARTAHLRSVSRGHGPPRIQGLDEAGMAYCRCWSNVCCGSKADVTSRRDRRPHCLRNGRCNRPVASSALCQ